MSFHKVSVLVIFLILLLVLVVPVSATQVDISSSGDTMIYKTSAGTTFTAIRNTATGTDISVQSYPRIVTGTTENQFIEFYRVAVIVPTASLPDDAVISSATLYLYRTTNTSNLGDTGVGITKFNIDGAIDVADYNNFGSDRFADDILISDSYTPGYYGWDFNALGIENISLTGNSGFFVRLAWDIDNSSPTWISGKYTSATFNSSTKAANTPYLRVVYTSESEDIPESITGLTNTTASNCTSLIWNWTNPTSASFNGTMIYKDGVYAYTLPNSSTSDVWVSSGYYGNETHEISTQTVNFAGSPNSTFVNASAKTIVCAAKTWPKVGIMFDDGRSTIYENAYPILEAYNFNATIYAITDKISANNTAQYLDETNLTLLDTAGWDIANHGQMHDAHVGDGTVLQQAEIKNGQDTLIALGLTRAAYHYAPGGGAYDAETILSARTVGALTLRIVNPGIITSPHTTLFPLNITHEVYNTDTMLHLTNHLKNGATNETVFFLFHFIQDPADEVTEYSVENFTTLSRWIYDNGYQPITISEWYTINGVPAYVTPIASFTANVTSGTVPLAVGFTDTSTNTPTMWNWSFGDGNWSNGTASAVSYLYEYPGTYNAFLIASNGGGSSTSATTTITVISSMVPQCENQTGNITLSLFFNSTTSLGWQWSDPVNITKIAEDGLYVLTFDNSSDSFIGTGYLPESWHRLRIYNETDFGQLNCTTDAPPIIPTPIPIMPSTESNINPVSILSYWWIVAIIGLIVVVFSR